MPTVDITCTKGSNGIGDIKAWAIIVTGEGVPNGQPMWSSQGGGGQTKLLGGPVWITDPGRSDLKSPVELEDGDIWYYRSDCTSPSLTLESNLTFTPEYRGTICVDEPWTAVYTAPVIGTVPATGDQSATDRRRIRMHGVLARSLHECAALGTNTYFKSGNYYFENVTLDVTNATVTAGWADSSSWGDQQFVTNAKCDGARRRRQQGSGSTSGATFYLGGTSKIEIGNKGSHRDPAPAAR